MNIKKTFLLLLFSILLIEKAYAHCPLCTIGAAAAAGGAAWLGVDQIVIGLFIGAFAVSMGWWISRIIKKKYIPFQKSIIILVSFITTILPLLTIINEVRPIPIFLTGDYGSLLNKTYLINMFLIGSIMGGLIVSITPWISTKITKLINNKIIPFQGVILTLSLLIIMGIILQFAI